MSSIKTISFSNYMDANATPFVNQKRKTAYPKLKGKRTKFKAPSTKLKFVGSSPVASLSQTGNRSRTNVRYKLYQEGDRVKRLSNIGGLSNFNFKPTYGPYALPDFTVISTNKKPNEDVTLNADTMKSVPWDVSTYDSLKNLEELQNYYHYRAKDDKKSKYAPPAVIAAWYNSGRPKVNFMSWDDLEKYNQVNDMYSYYPRAYYRPIDNSMNILSPIVAPEANHFFAELAHSWAQKHVPDKKYVSNPENYDDSYDIPGTEEYVAHKIYEPHLVNTYTKLPKYSSYPYRFKIDVPYYIMNKDGEYEKLQQGGYTVKKGDTLWALGQKYGVNWQDIAKENNISDPRMLQIGSVLNIPGQSQKPVITTQPIQQPKQQNITYTAQGPEVTVTANKPTFRENQVRPQTNLQAARDAYAYGNPIPSVMPQSRFQKSENALEQLLFNPANLVQTPEPIVEESISQPQENVTPIAKTLAELPKGLTRNSSIRPTVGGSYRSGNVGVEAMKKFKNENPNVKTIVYLKGPLENKKGSQGLDANTLREMGYDVKVLPVGRLSGEGEKANFRKAVDMVKQGNVLVMCEHGYDRTGAVCAQAALESGYDMNTVIDHNVWRENDKIYPYVSGKGGDYAPYFDNLVIPKQQMGGSTTNIPPTRVTHDRIVQTINDMSAQGKSYDEIMGNIDNLLLLRDKQQKVEGVQKDMIRAQQPQKYWIDGREVSEEEYNRMAQQFPDRYSTSIPR